MNLKKINRLHHELEDAMARKQRTEESIPQVKDELQQFYEDLVDEKDKNSILIGRKKKGFWDRLTNAQSQLMNVDTEISVIQKALTDEGSKVCEELLVELSRERGVTAQKSDAIKEKIATLNREINQLGQEHYKLEMAKETQRSQILNFQRQFTPDRIIRLITDPANDEFARDGNVVRFLPPDVESEWQQAADKRTKQQQQERERALKEQQARIQRNKEFTDRALRICAGKEPMPPELAPLYNNTSIELNVLTDFLRRKADAKAVT